MGIISNDTDYSYMMSRLRDLGTHVVVIYSSQVPARTLLQSADLGFSLTEIIWEHKITPSGGDESETSDICFLDIIETLSLDGYFASYLDVISKLQRKSRVEGEWVMDLSIANE